MFAARNKDYFMLAGFFKFPCKFSAEIPPYSADADYTYSQFVPRFIIFYIENISPFQ